MNEKSMLSQQEIDALLANDGYEDIGSSGEQAGESDLTGFEVDALGEIGNISFGSASTALSSILGKKVQITTPEVELVAADELNVEFPVPHAAVSVKYTDGFSGTNMLVIKKLDAAIIADLMMGGAGEVEDDTLSEMHMSAVQEAMNQMMGSAATSMSTIFDTVVNISPPTVEVIDFSESNKPKHELGEGMLVKVSFQLTVGDLIDSYIMQLIPISFAKEMAAKLAEISSTPPQQDVASSQEEAAASVVEESPPQPRPQPPQSDMPKQPARDQHSRPESDALTERNHPPKEVQAAEFAPLVDEQGDARGMNFGLFMDIPLQVTVELGRTERSIEDLLSISPGAVIELDKLAGEPVDILVNQKLIARGEVVVVDENFGVRVTDIHNKNVRLEQLR